MKNYTPGPWQYMVTRRHSDIVVASTSNGTVIVKTGHLSDDDCNNTECCKTVEHANAQRIVECVNAMDQIRQPIEFMDCLLDTMEHIKIMMKSNGLNETRKGIYDDVCATIDDLQRNKNLPCNK